MASTSDHWRRQPRDDRGRWARTPGLSRLARAVAAGIVDTRPVTQAGDIAQVDIVTLGDGTQAIRKTATGYDEGFDPRHQTDAEELASAVGLALGLNVPEVVRTDEHQVVMELLPGEPAAAVYRNLQEPIATGLITPGTATVIGLFDVIIGNTDRHGWNWLIDDEGNVRLIDHGRSWRPLPMIGNQLFGRMVVDGINPVPNVLSVEDLRTAAERLAALGDEFDRLERGGWLEMTLDRLRRLEPWAWGIRPLIGPPRQVEAASDHWRYQPRDRYGRWAWWPRRYLPAPVGRSAPMPRVSGLPFSRLERSLAGGFAEITPVNREGNAGVEFVTLRDGTRAIRKTIPGDDGWLDRRHQADAEQLASVVGHALGVGVPEVIRTGEYQVVMQRVPGRVAAEVFDDVDEAVLSGRVDYASAAVAGLFDQLICNADRHEYNWLVDDEGRIWLIDHARAWSGWDMAERFPFDTMFLSGSQPTHNPLTPEDFDTVRQRLRGVRPQFEALGRLDWWEESMWRLEILAEWADGVEPLVGPPRRVQARVPVLRAGQWPQPHGMWTATEEDLVAAASAARCPAVGGPVVLAGDPPTPVGRVEQLTVDGRAWLVGKATGVPAGAGTRVEGRYQVRCRLGHTHPFVVARVMVDPPGGAESRWPGRLCAAGLVDDARVDRAGGGDRRRVAGDRERGQQVAGQQVHGELVVT